MAEDRQIRTKDVALIAGIGLIQGLAVAALVEISSDEWLEANPWLARLFWGWAIFLPVTLQWLTAHPKRSFLGLMLATVGALTALTAWHTARLVPPGQAEISADAWLAVAGAMAWLALMTLGEFAAGGGRRTTDYPLLYGLAARNLLLPAGAGLFTLLVGGLNAIWSGLFDLLGFDRFAEILLDPWILLPLLGSAFGAATAILLNRPTLLDGARRVISAGGSALLPLAGLIVIAFVAGVVIAGPRPLWATGQATPLILLLAAAYVLFLNVAHDTGSNPALLPRPLLIFVRFATCLLPVLIAISIYSFALRVAQYGWTIDRVLGATALAFAAFVAVAYCAASLRLRATLPLLAMANMVTLGCALVVGILINTPIFSPLHIAARDQIDRVLDGTEQPASIDWRMFAYDLGNPGRAALKQLATARDQRVSEEIRQSAQRALDAPDPWVHQFNRQIAEGMNIRPAMRVIPGNRDADDTLIAAIRATQKRSPRHEMCISGCDILALDLNEDGIDEMTVLSGDFSIYEKTPDGWTRAGRLHVPPAKEREELIEKLRGGAARSAAPALHDVMIGDLRLQAVTEDRGR